MDSILNTESNKKLCPHYKSLEDKSSINLLYEVPFHTNTLTKHTCEYTVLKILTWNRGNKICKPITFPQTRPITFTYAHTQLQHFFLEMYVLRHIIISIGTLLLPCSVSLYTFKRIKCVITWCHYTGWYRDNTFYRKLVKSQPRIPLF